MNDYSLAILVGRLTRDPELKYTNPGGIPYLRLSVAINRETTKADASRVKTVSFVDVSVWRKLAELCAQFLRRGSAVMVVGSLRQSRWTGRDGAPRNRVEVQADRIQFLNRRDGAPAPAPPGAEESLAEADPDEAEAPAEPAA